MKTINIIIIVLLSIGLGSNSYAQMQDHSTMNMGTSKTETLKVSGNCGMCKARIEKAAKIDGVSKAEWDAKTKTLSATFDPAKTSIDAIAKKVAAAGHDNEKFKAEDKIYKSLPGCCQYR
jgi:copper chaperone CopZ